MTHPTYTPEQIEALVAKIGNLLDDHDRAKPEIVYAIRELHKLVASLAGPGAVLVGLLVGMRRRDLAHRLRVYLASWSDLAPDRLPDEDGNGGGRS